MLYLKADGNARFKRGSITYSIFLEKRIQRYSSNLSQILAFKNCSDESQQRVVLKITVARDLCQYASAMPKSFSITNGKNSGSPQNKAKTFKRDCRFLNVTAGM